MSDEETSHLRELAETTPVTSEVIDDLEQSLVEAHEVPRPRVQWTGGKHRRLINRSRPFTGWKLAVAYLAVVGFGLYTVHSHLTWGYQSGSLFLAVFFSLIGVLITYFLLSAVHWRSFTSLPVAHGRVLCIMPVYNEESELVHDAVMALLRQTILPDAIHVIDDGSAVPLETFEHPLITWHRIPNGGKREAQATALRMYKGSEWDYIFTVDSDSVCDEDALEHMLRAMSDDRIQACTGMIYVRNWDTNILTRFTDINVVTSCLLFRMARSILGIVSPTSGALALYRAAVVYDNLDDYLENANIGGGAGDDRRLSFYAMLRGQVVGVTEAVVCTQLPDRWGDCFRQRMRWSKSAFLGTPFVLTNMRWLFICFYMFPLIFLMMWPFILAALVTLWITTGNGLGLWRGFLFWEICAVTQTWIYALYRPGFRFRDRVTQWLLAPVYPILGLAILRPAAYWALTKLKDTSWLTREVAVKPVVIADSQESTL